MLNEVKHLNPSPDASFQFYFQLFKQIGSRGRFRKPQQISHLLEYVFRPCPTLSHLFQRSCPRRFGEFFSVFVRDKRVVQEIDFQKISFYQTLGEVKLCLCGCLQVSPSNDVRNAKMHIVCEARHLVGRNAVAAAHHEVWQRKTRRCFDAPSHVGVVEAQVLIPKCWWIIALEWREIAARFPAGEEQARGAEFFQCIEIERQTPVLRPVFFKIFNSRSDTF